MANTTKLGVPLLAADQSQKHVTHNEALLRYDQLVQQTVINRTTAVPPGSPSEGDSYVIASPATGDWVGRENQIAAFLTGIWVYFMPRDGWLVYDEAVSAHVVFDGSNWVSLSVAFTKPTLAQVSITHPADPGATVSLTGTLDEELDPAVHSSSYVTVLNEYSQVYLQGAKLTVDADGRINVVEACSVHIDGYLDLSHTANDTVVGAAFSIERGASTILSPRAVHSEMPNNGDIGHLSGNGFVDLLVGDKVGIALAASNTGTVRIFSSSLTFTAY